MHRRRRIANWSIAALAGTFLIGNAPAYGSLSADRESAEDVASPSAEAQAPAQRLFVSAGRLILRPGEILENGKVLVEDGRIVAIGADLEVPSGVEEVRGNVVCAAFLDPWSSLGLSSTAASDNSTSAGTRTVDSVDLYSDEVTRRDALRAGVTVVRAQAGEVSPIGGIGAVLKIAPGLGSDEAVVLDESNVAATLSLMNGNEVSGMFDRLKVLDGLVGDIESGQKYVEDQVEYRYELEEWQKAIAEKEEELEKDFKKAKKDREKDQEKAEEKGKEFKEKKYKEDKKPRAPRYDLDKEVMGRAAEGELCLVVHANRAAELRELLKATEPFDRLRMVVAGGSAALHVAEELAEREIPVIVRPLPYGTRSSEMLGGHDLSLAGRLEEAGVDVLIGSGGGSGMSRDLPLMAGLLIGHGLSRDEAFAALTERAARVFDVSDRLGSVRVGHDAELLVLDGEPLVSTTRVQYVISGGRLAVTPEDQ